MPREVLPPDSIIDEYEREMTALAKLSGHPNVVLLYGIVLKPLAIVLEKMDSSLADYFSLAEWKFANDREKFIILQQVTTGVSYLHSRRFLHRDLKPHNILVKRAKGLDIDLVCKIADFGTAIELTGEHESARGVCGTSGYTGSLDTSTVFSTLL
jgi:serine/threonine protein kinase